VRLTQLFVNRPTLVFVALALVLMAGIFALSTLVQQNLPNIDFPTVNVSVSYPGASATELRDAVVRPIEDAIAGAPNLDHINSSIQTNQASISATFTLDSNQTTDLVEVQDRVQTARAALPADLPAPAVRTFDPAQATVVTLSVTSSSLSFADLSALITDKIVPALEQIQGISNVNAGGTVTPAIEVTVDPNKLSASGYTLNDIVNSIQANNVRAPGGIAYLPHRETSIDVRGDIQTPKSVAQLLLTGSSALPGLATSPSGTSQTRYTGTTSTTNQALSLGSASISSEVDASVNAFSVSPRLSRVSDVAKVTNWYEPKRVYSYVNGQQAITLGLQKATGASEVAAGEAVIAALPAIERQFPQVQFRTLNVQADFTKQQLYGVLQTLLEGIAFTGIVMFFFLRSWRNGLVVMIAIPTSLLVSFFIMRLLGFTIDTVSLLAMTLIIGILVDDSIVVLENVERHYEDGEAPRTAAILGRSEIGMAAVVITLVDVVVFLPIAFLPGITGRFLAEFGVVVTFATLTSLAVSFMITPSLAGNWSLLSNWKPPGFIDGFTRGFTRLRGWYVDHPLNWGLAHPRTVVAVSAVLTIGAVALIPLGFVGFEFIPSIDRGEIFVQVQYPTGTPLTTTDAAVKALNQAYMQIPEVQTITSTSGSYQAGFGGGINLGSNGQLHIFLSDDHKRSTAVIARIMGGIGHRVAPAAKITAIPATGTGGGNSQPIDITVASTQSDANLSTYAEKVLGVIQNTPGTANVNSSALQLAPQIDVTFDRDRARALDLDIGSAALAVRAAFGGTLATQYDTDNGSMYVQVLYPMSAQTSIKTLRDITMRTRSGQIVRLGDVAILQNAPAQPLITRVNRQTVIHLSSNVQPGAALSTVQAAVLKGVKALNLPHDIIVGMAAGGQQQNLRDTINGMGVALLLSFTLVYLLMVALYNAYRVPLVIMFSVPVAAIGAFGALAATGQSLNLYSLIGTVMLIGLVSKNGILLVDFAELKVLAGLSKAAAIKQAARERFRPIIMTTVSMIAGMLPLALALDPGSAAKRSLGTVVIGGLASSLLLTLVLVPVVYQWLAPGPPERVEPEELARDAASRAALPVESPT
jgi:HAE1 family hydrophobic/amphiphilic exporter-1